MGAAVGRTVAEDWVVLCRRPLRPPPRPPQLGHPAQEMTLPDPPLLPPRSNQTTFPNHPTCKPTCKPQEPQCSESAATTPSPRSH